MVFDLLICSIVTFQILFSQSKRRFFHVEWGYPNEPFFVYQQLQRIIFVLVFTIFSTEIMFEISFYKIFKNNLKIWFWSPMILKYFLCIDSTFCSILLLLEIFNLLFLIFTSYNYKCVCINTNVWSFEWTIFSAISCCKTACLVICRELLIKFTNVASDWEKYLFLYF